MIPNAPPLSRRSSILVVVSSLFGGLLSLFVASACDAGSSGPRALILVDASDAAKPDQAGWILARSAELEKALGRAVRVLRIPDAAGAIELAARGEADVVVLPAEASAGDRLARFFASDHGREIGVVAIGDARLKVLVVNPKQHPKVDAQGEALAKFLVESNMSPAPR